MKLTLWRCVAFIAAMALSIQAQAQANPPAQASAPSATAAPSLSMNCHLLYRGVPMKEATTYQVIGAELYGISGPIRTKLSQAGTPVSLGMSKEADGTSTESFASHTVNGTTLERTVFWKKVSAAMKPAFKETYDFKAKTVVSSTDKSDFCHANGK
ncbi:MAG: hypothetical protein EPO41_11605 [Reyranella sp.]|uniref:hypothetical protein n=1 Tax=Reyranella sp. TaxID=1929291 RepID=UPI0012149342|nr:hypothetical protein [Reyranella sp.]TAJ94710.1 MAG: hypothetical protein EPO41_11605 [Reyranella sp.]